MKYTKQWLSRYGKKTVPSKNNNNPAEGGTINYAENYAPASIMKKLILCKRYLFILPLLGFAFTNPAYADDRTESQDVEAMENVDDSLSSSSYSDTEYDTGSITEADAWKMGTYEKGWRFYGYDRNNTADSSKESNITKSNVSKLKIKWIYNNGSILSNPSQNPNPNPPNNPRLDNSAATGVAVDRKGRVYVSLWDGRLISLDSNQVNADGSPKLLSTFDFFSDPQYNTLDSIPGDSALNGDDVFYSRMFPTLIGDTVYAAKNNKFLAANFVPSFLFQDKNTGVPNPTNPGYVSKGAVLYALDRFTGKLKWKSVLDNNPQTMVTGAGLSKAGNLLYVGLSGQISGNIALFPFEDLIYSDQCCTYRGAIVALDRKTGKVVWKTYTAPTPAPISTASVLNRGSVNQFWGGSVWGGGNFPISFKHKLIYAGTGEMYSAPDANESCELQRLRTVMPGFVAPPPGMPIPDSAFPGGKINNLISTKCLQADLNQTNPNFADMEAPTSTAPMVRAPKNPLASSIVAMDYRTGAIKWATPLQGYDVWNATCFASPDGTPGFLNFFTPLCPLHLRSEYLALQGITKDLDVAEQPILIPKVTLSNGTKKDVLIATTKGANVYGLDAETGAILWGPTSVGRGGLNGLGDGFIWGSAADQKRFYSVTGISSDITFANLNSPDMKVVPGSCPLNAAGTAFIDGSTKWNGGVYVAINLADGKIAWQRCVVGTQVDPVTRVARPDLPKFPGRAQAPVSVANGILIASGASSYTAFGLNTPDDPFAEILLIDTNNGTLLKSLPMSLPGQPTANTVIYQRPIAIGNRIYITNGAGSPTVTGVPSPQDSQNRVIMYELSND
jgi:outer membrane protein assembly factor BamB